MNAMSVQPWPISSMVRLPQPIQADGSGLCRLLAVLSCHETVWRIVPLRKQVRFLEGIDDLPRLLVVGDVGQHLAAPVEVNRLQQHPLAAEVHVGLEAQDQRGLRQRPEALVADDAVRGDAEQRDAVQRVVVDQGAGRHPVGVQVEVVAGAQQPVLHRLAVQLPVMPDAGPDAVRGDDELRHLPRG